MGKIVFEMGKTVVYVGKIVFEMGKIVVEVCKNLAQIGTISSRNVYHFCLINPFFFINK